MGLCISTTSRLPSQSAGRTGQAETYGEFQRQSPRVVSIHILDDDSLLHVFYLYRPFLLGEDEDLQGRIWGGNEGWDRGRWWYKLAHVCKRWRNVLLGSTSYLDICLVCTYGTPVADMLAHSPPLPLVIDYRSLDMTAEDEEGAILALKQRDRVRRIRLEPPSGAKLQKLLVAMDDEYPILEYLIIELPTDDNSSILRFQETLNIPHLRQLRLRGFTLPTGSRLLTTSVSLVTLSLLMIHPSTYFHPNTLLQWISPMSQLETLSVYIHSPISNHDVESQLTHTPVVVPTGPITLPNLRHFLFRGASTYLEALIHRITSPRLEKLIINFLKEITFSIPCILQFMTPAQNLRFDSAKFIFFDKKVGIAVYPHVATMHVLSIIVFCQQLNWQVSSMAQISNSLNPMLSAVERLNFAHEEHSQSSEEHNAVDRTEWSQLLRPFVNVKTLRIDNGLVKDLSRCLESGDGEDPLELLPELQEITCSGSDDTGDGFTSFIDARRNAGRSVTLVRS